MTPRWYWNRLRRMSPTEIAGRMTVAVRQSYWASEGRRPGGSHGIAVTGPQKATICLPAAWARSGGMLSPAATRAVAAADALLAGDWPVFHIQRKDVPAEPNWFQDALTGINAPRRGYAFRLPYRDDAHVGNVKHVWEPSRHQATTLLAVAWWLTGNSAYADRVALHLTSWWRDNPFLEGIHWTSGIEVGLRLLSWTWIRALLADWEGCAGLFDANDAFSAQLYHHQRYIVAFHSRGSSANNHLIAELAGLACASVAFPWFKQSLKWERWSYRHLVKEAIQQTHPDGFNREQASDYHLFVFEMLLATSLATRLAGKPLAPAMDEVLQRMADALAASVDAAGRPPRFGDGDDGRGLLLDGSETDFCGALLGAAESLVGAASWWPKNTPRDGVFAEVAARICNGSVAERQTPYPSLFPGSGQAIMRAGRGDGEIWVRCDHGPLGYLAIAAHGHADALSVELRCGGIEVLADPGTYCYHGEPEWRRYFKGTTGHNTLAVEGLDQIVYGGPFLWLTELTPRLEQCSVSPDRTLQEWQALHEGYRRLADPVTHHRRVVLDAGTQILKIEDWIDAIDPHEVVLSFHLGPSIQATLERGIASLRWSVANEMGQIVGQALIKLPSALRWTLHSGETAPPLGWYSRGFGHREPALTLVGRGVLVPNRRLATAIELHLFPGKPARSHQET